MRSLELLRGIDHRLFYWCADSRYKQSLTSTARLISFSGDGYLHILLPLIIYSSNPANGEQLFKTLCYALAFERLLYWILKNSCRRQRPPEKLLSFKSVILASDKFSFPSGHTSGAFLLATIMLCLYGPWMSIFFIWAIAVGISRVILGVHFPTDIIAGATLGSTIALTIHTQGLL